MNEDKEEAFFFCIEEVGAAAGNEISFSYKVSGELGEILGSESEARQEADKYRIVKDPGRNAVALSELQNNDCLFEVPLTKFFGINSRAKVIQLSTYSKISGLVMNIRYEVMVEGDDRVIYTSSSLDLATGRAEEKERSEIKRININISGVNSRPLKSLKI